MNCRTIVVFLSISITVVLSGFVNAQISPGDLVQAHAHLEGISNCTKCHTLGDKVTNEKCLDCHKIINNLISQNRGYHVSAEVKEKYCFECHNDHHGRNFQIIRFDPDNFDHSLSGYKLEGAHARQECKKCHEPDNIEIIELKEREFTYLGLEQKCLSCHEDYHRGTLSQNCSSCHNIEAFRPAPGFNHNNSNFILKGKHKTVDCIKCHKIEFMNGEEFQVFSGIAYSKCTDCHADPHDNQFGQNCTQCHTEESFHLVRNIESFNHNITRFPLKGKHQQVDCRLCHKNNYTDPLAFNKCMDCHVDFHGGQFVQKKPASDCSDCHTVNGFQGSTFTIERHMQTKFPLEGSHMATPCFVCHLKNDEWKFTGLGKQCIDCHQDIHDNFIDKSYYPDANCKACHEISLWRHVSFDHEKTEFKLEGAHLDVSCRKCHFDEVKGVETQRFNDLTSNCTECHVDIHYNQFEEQGLTDCTKCHAFVDWAASEFDHNTARFILEGKHKDVPCARCHEEITQGNITYINYRTGRLKCEDCH